MPWAPKSLEIAGFGVVLGWPFAAIVRRFGPRSHSTFFFYMDPLTKDGGPGCYLQRSSIGLSMGPLCMGPLWSGPRHLHVGMGWLQNRDFEVTPNNPRGALSSCWVIIW